MITFIVSAFDRPGHLKCCLASLAIQTEPNQIIVADNSVIPEIGDRHRAMCYMFGAHYIHTRSLGATECYDGIETVLKHHEILGNWLCFPSDDSYYVPVFSELMMKAARENDWDLVYCDLLYDSRCIHGKYAVLHVDPWPCSIDKICFMVKRNLFTEFPGKVPGMASCSDGLLVQQLVKQGVAHGKAPGGALVVHN